MRVRLNTKQVKSLRKVLLQDQNDHCNHDHRDFDDHCAFDPDTTLEGQRALQASISSVLKLCRFWHLVGSGCEGSALQWLSEVPEIRT